MDENNQRLLHSLIEKTGGARLDEDGWRRVDRALTLIDESLRTGTEAWVAGRNDLVMLSPSTRARHGLRDSLDGRTDQTAPPQTRELIGRLLHRLGPPPADARRPDDAA